MKPMKVRVNTAERKFSTTKPPPASKGESEKQYWNLEEEVQCSPKLKPWQTPFCQISHLKDTFSEQTFNLPFVCNDLASMYLSSLKIRDYPENLYSTY